MSWLARMRLDKDALAGCPFPDSYAWHQAIWRCFPGKPDAKRDFLFRTDFDNDGCVIHLLCGSVPTRPEWCPQTAWEMKEVAPSFLQHRTYAFDLLATPVRDVPVSDWTPGKRGKRIPLLKEADRREWLDFKSERHGFNLIGPVLVDNAGQNAFQRKSMKGVHSGARFRGRLEVVDRERFIDAFTNGIGRGKAFGYGLFMLKPLS